MNLKELFEQETGFKGITGEQGEPCGHYVQWLEDKVNSKPEALTLLRDLADLQNGPPLERHRKEWEETMHQVYDFLNKHEPQTII